MPLALSVTGGPAQMAAHAQAAAHEALFGARSLMPPAAATTSVESSREALLLLLLPGSGDGHDDMPAALQAACAAEAVAEPEGSDDNFSSTCGAAGTRGSGAAAAAPSCRACSSRKRAREPEQGADANAGGTRSVAAHRRARVMIRMALAERLHRM